MGRRLRGCLPSLSLPTFDKMAYEEARCKYAEKIMDQHATKPALAELAVGDLVSIQDPRLGWWSGRGIVKKIRLSGRSYEVETSAGIFVCKLRIMQKLPIPTSSRPDFYLADAD